MAVRSSLLPFVLTAATGPTRVLASKPSSYHSLSRTCVCNLSTRVLNDSRLTRYPVNSPARFSSARGSPFGESTSAIQLKPRSRDCEILRDPRGESGISYGQVVVVVRRRGVEGRPAASSSMDLSTKSNGGGRELEQQGAKRPPFFTEVGYSPPSWASHLHPIPPSFVSLARLPTPIHRWHLPGLPSGTELWIKRDDLSGMQLSGNKVRKLEFLLADAKAQGADCVITIGGIQSNHCRATAVAARYLGLDAYLILRTSRTVVDEDPGLEGNLLVERLVGAHIDLVTKEEYVKYGSEALGAMLVKRLRSEGRKPYLIPVGGSNSIGSWGTLDLVKEIELQLRQGDADGATHFDDFVVACGSGGTPAGLALGSHLGSLKSKVHAYFVCDNANYFYDYIQGLLDGFSAGVSSRDIVALKDARGLGYAMSTAEELKVVKDVAEKTGVILDPVYSGKAISGFVKDVNENPGAWQGRKVLFMHTGGLLGMYDKVDQLQPMVAKSRRMVFDSVP